MLVSHRYKCVYIAPPRTGSLSLHDFFYWNIAELEVIPGNKHHEVKLTPDLDSYIKIISVRNPYTRFLSLYRYGKNHPDNAKFLTQECFEIFVTQQINFKGTWFTQNIQMDYIRGISIDFVIHLESILEDLQRLPFPFCNRAKIERKNESTNFCPVEITEPLAEQIFKWGKEDFSQFGYKKDSWKTPYKGGCQDG